MSDWLSQWAMTMMANHALLIGALADCPIVEVMRWVSMILALHWLVRLLLHSLLLRKLKNKCAAYQPQSYARLWQIYRKAAADLGLKKIPPLLKSPFANIPAFTVGSMQPIVLLHPGMLQNLDDEELSCALTHELVHIKRKDNLLMWALELCPVFMPFLVVQLFGVDFSCRPSILAIILIGTTLAVTALRYFLIQAFRAMRENSCDDRTVHVTNAPLPLASSLIKAWQFMGQPSTSPQSNRLAWSYILLINGPCVEKRVNRLIDYKPPRLMPLLAKAGKAILLGTVLAYGFLLWQYHFNRGHHAVKNACSTLSTCAQTKSG